MELPIAVGTVGDRIRINPRARLALRVLDVQGARGLAAVMAAVGLGQNFAALRALATEGIQRGHMSLHARVVARAAGATGDLVEKVAAELARLGDIKPERARAVLADLRRAVTGPPALEVSK